MKKAVVLAVVFLTLLGLFGCGADDGNREEPAEGKTMTVTFVNGVKEADVWILPQTEKNHKTTVWGTATIPKVKTGESRQAQVEVAEDGGVYMFRMIDVDEYFYAADDIQLEEGWVVQLRKSDPYTELLEVSDENGVVLRTYEVFSASL